MKNGCKSKYVSKLRECRTEIHRVNEEADPLKTEALEVEKWIAARRTTNTISRIYETQSEGVLHLGVNQRQK